MAEWSPYAIYLKNLTGTPRVAVAHNLESSIWRAYVEKAGNPLKRAFINHQYHRVQAFENRIFRQLEGLITVSPLELDQVRTRHPKLNAVLVDNGVDLEYFSLGDETEEDHLVTFTGSMDWRPNQDAVVYLIEDILPQLRQLVESVRLVIVGRQPPEWLVNLGRKHAVEFTGSVEDVRPYVRRSAVSIVPLRIGGGSRLKILEALGMKKAIVSTTLGAEGLELENGRDLIIADQPRPFAEAVAELMADPERRHRLGERGHARVSERYRWQELARVQIEFLESLVKAKSDKT
jgi:glycosyltransferase involved in cell wall biosynthesis